VADRLAQAPHVVPSPLVDRDLEPGLGGQRFEHAGECRCGSAVRQADAASEAGERNRVGPAAHLGVVHPRHALAGVEQRVGQLSTSLAVLNGTIEGVNGTVGQLTSGLTTLNMTVGGINGQLGGINSTLSLLATSSRRSTARSTRPTPISTRSTRRSSSCC